MGALPIQKFDSNCRDVAAWLQVPFLSWQSLLKTASKCFFNGSKCLSFSRALTSALCGFVRGAPGRRRGMGGSGWPLLPGCGCQSKLLPCVSISSPALQEEQSPAVSQR